MSLLLLLALPLGVSAETVPDRDQREFNDLNSTMSILNRPYTDVFFEEAYIIGGNRVEFGVNPVVWNRISLRDRRQIFGLMRRAFIITYTQNHGVTSVDEPLKIRFRAGKKTLQQADIPVGSRP